MPERANRLIQETSPYLLQHAHNPVDWYPWGDEAFRAAREQGKPVLLSIGYSACHWCHVMERESFENEDIARLMNEHFINIKVDREERPDVDEIYMNAVQLMTGHGGWPLTLFLTPEGEPYYGGTYFPPEDRHGMPGFPRVLRAAADALGANMGEVRRVASEVRGQLAALARPPAATLPSGPAALTDLAGRLLETHDREHGGFGRAPKFPHPDALAFLLRSYAATLDRRFLDPVLHTLRAMARGGIYDQLGGGFHRYTTDARWQVPHFEKMLYDNALLPRVYLEAYQITGESEFRRVVDETIGYLLREMAHPEGGFFSSQDADSEGEEGRYFVWSAREIEEALGEEDARVFGRYYGVTDVGNFEGENILHVTLDTPQVAKLYNVPEESMGSVLDRGRQTLLALRSQRIPPAHDDKIILGWNGLILSLLAEVFRVLGDRRALEAAERTVRFVDRHLRAKSVYLHSFKDGRSGVSAFLDDHAFWAEGLLDLYEATLDQGYLDRARHVAERALERFEDREGGGFFYSAEEHRTPILRTKPSYDGALPSGNSVLPHVLLRLYHYLFEERHARSAERALAVSYETASRQPFGACRYLSTMDFYLRRPLEVFILAAPEDPGAEPLLGVLRRAYIPNRSIRRIDPKSTDGLPEPLRGKTQVDGRPTAYVCRHFACSLPLTSADDLSRALSAPDPAGAR